MKFSLAQINTTVGDLEGNYKKIKNYIFQAKKEKCDIIIFPELVITGYCPEDLLLKSKFIEDQLLYVDKLKELSNDICIILGIVTKQLYNSCYVLGNKKVQHIHVKRHLPNYSVFDEERYFDKGLFLYPDDMILEINGKKIGFQICEEIWKEDVIEQQKGGGAEIIINISCSPYYINKLEERQKLLRRRAQENNCMICYCNLVGGQDELIFDGGSIIVNEKGKEVARSPQFQEDLLIYEIGDQKTFPKIPILEYEIYEALKLGLKDYVYKNGFKKIVLGLSGGIDSAFVATLAVDALGANNVYAISMPTQYNSNETQSDARQLAQNLKINFDEISIQNLFNTYKTDVIRYIDGKDITIQNLQARIRGNIIMAISNDRGYLPLSTGNKSEIAMGYCTLYGDTASGYAPIKDLYKTEIFKLCKWLNGDRERIPNSIINRPPSAELKDNQKDADSLPPYPLIDVILKLYLEENKTRNEIYDLTKAGHLIDQVLALLKRAEYKRRQMPPGTKITKHAFGRDHRWPLTNKYNE